MRANKTKNKITNTTGLWMYYKHAKERNNSSNKSENDSQISRGKTIQTPNYVND